jgi:nitroreductase
MELNDAIKKRRSIRQFSDKPIPKEALEKLADAGRFAATARNIQPWEFILITEIATLRKLGEMAENGRFLGQSKACIAVFCAETKYYLEDGCAATQNILLAATESGIGSCWVAGDKKPYCQEVSRVLNVPDKFKLVSLIALGYPEGEGFKIADKRPLRDLIHWDKF